MRDTMDRRRLVAGADGSRHALPIATIAAALLLAAAPAPSTAAGPGTIGSYPACAVSARAAFGACITDVAADTYSALAVCTNDADPEAREACAEGVLAAHHEAIAECAAIDEARDDVCDLLGPATYRPDLDPARFVAGIDNPRAPFHSGAWWRYQKETDDGLETILVEVLDETREIVGIAATVVRDRVWLDGVLVEDTTDWLAQDIDGNVWYLGEIAQNFEDGLLRDLDGSWETGRDGALPGIWMPGRPSVALSYRQEWDPGNAEDVTVVVSTDADPTGVPFANGQAVLQTANFTPLEPGALELKFYVPGVGLVLETKPGSGERLELVDFGR
ncbi:MAG: hypothetical protein H6983_03085 [Ectothiorhodospiraceae bacterium]|nr:hypothetical protein [Ectothiorhodospiraceae bacterium]